MDQHTYALPTDTRHVKIRSRQYDLFNKDLGEGFERQKALVVAIIVAMFFFGRSVRADEQTTPDEPVRSPQS